MKVAYITMQFPVPSETFASWDISLLEEMGTTVDVYSMRPQHRLFKDLVTQRDHKPQRIFHLSLPNFCLGVKSMMLHPIYLGVLVFHILKYCKRSPKHIFKSLILLPSAFYIFEKIRKSVPDIVHLFWGHYPSLCVVLLKRYNKDLPITTFLGAHDLEENYALSKVAIRESAFVFTHSKANTEKILGLGARKAKLKVSYRGTFIDELELRQPKALKRDSLYLLTAARLIKEKGVEEVLSILSGLHAKGLTAKLTIAGDGPDKDRLAKLVEELNLSNLVRFTGHVSQKKLFELMAESDFFILMSRFNGERLPNVIKEAMLRGVVPVTTPTRGIEELISSGVDGWVVREAEEAIRKIKTTIDTPNCYETMAENGIGKILQRFNVKQNMSEYKRLWEKILGWPHQN